MECNVDPIDGITFKVRQVADPETICVAAIRYLLIQLGDEKGKLPKEIDVTAWLQGMTPAVLQ